MFLLAKIVRKGTSVYGDSTPCTSGLQDRGRGVISATFLFLVLKGEVEGGGGGGGDCVCLFGTYKDAWGRRQISTYGKQLRTFDEQGIVCWASWLQ